ncbi:hypothetical protein H9X77_00320 [Clostridium saudiense]|nr:hypothetical protein [Clostridium saudiense]
MQMVKRFAYANVQRCLRQEKGFACANGEKICLRKCPKVPAAGEGICFANE